MLGRIGAAEKRDDLDASVDLSTLPVGFIDVKARIHELLLHRLDLDLLEKLEERELRERLTRLVKTIYDENRFGCPLNSIEKSLLVAEVVDEVLGFGPLEHFLRDGKVSDILVNGHDSVYVERDGKLSLTSVKFRDDSHLLKIISKIVSGVGRRVDESAPMVDARLPDGSRVNAIIPPLAVDGPVLSIRRFGSIHQSLEDLAKTGSLGPESLEMFKGMAQCKLNIMISGGTGCGKTTLLNLLSRYIGSDERIVTIEDSAELQLRQRHVIRLETRPRNIEGQGEVTQRDLVRNTLRMRPDRIILGEIRGEEAFDVLQAMNTGHAGSMTTIHANSPKDAMLRLETMLAMAKIDIPLLFLRRYISSAIDVIIHVERLSDGTRKIMSVQEVMGMDADVILLNDIYNFEIEKIESTGKIRGRHIFTGTMPRFLKKFAVHGVPFGNQDIARNSK